GEELRTTEFPDGSSTETLSGGDGSTLRAHASGAIVEEDIAPDPRFGMTAPFVALAALEAPSGGRIELTRTREVTFSDASDVFAVAAEIETHMHNGRISTHLWDAASATLTSTSTLGRTREVTLDEA